MRSLLTDGTLAYQDMPLVFVIQAALAYGIGDIPWAVRLSDALLPTVVVIPLLWLYRDCARSKSYYALFGLALVILFHPIQLYYFTGDFIKNEAALPFIFVLGWLLIHWKDAEAWKYSLGVVTTLIVIALSHYGVLFLGGIMMVVWLLAHLRTQKIRFWIIAVVVVSSGIGLMQVALELLVPERFARLMVLVRNPLTFFQIPIGMLMIFGVSDVLRNDIIFTVISGQLGSIVFSVWAWRIRDRLSYADKTALISLLATAFMCSSPLIGYDWAARLIALSFAPLILAAWVLWTHATTKWATVVVLGLVSCTVAVSLHMYTIGPTKPVFNDAELRDFNEMVTTVELVQPSLVVARHGVDFLVAWHLNTHVVEEDAFRSGEVDEYRGIYILKEWSSKAESPSSMTQQMIFENNSFSLYRLTDN